MINDSSFHERALTYPSPAASTASPIAAPASPAGSSPTLGVFVVIGCALSLCLIMVGCGSEPGAGEAGNETGQRAGGFTPQPVPEPSVEGAEKAVKQQIAEARQAVAKVNQPADQLAEAYYRLGLIYLTYDFLDAAEISFENAYRLEPNDYRWSYITGVVFQMTGRLDAAVPRLERALELDPEYLPATVRLADAFAELDQSERAKELFDQALERDPELPFALEGLGELASRAGDDQRAVELWERTLELQPQANSLHYALSQAYRRLGNMDRARYHLERRGDTLVAIEDPLMNPTLSLGRSAQFFLTKAGTAMENRTYDAAADAYGEALELDPENFPARIGRSYALRQLGDLEGGLDELRQALATATTGDPTEDIERRREVRLRLATALISDGRDQEAIEPLRETLGDDSQSLEEKLNSRLLMANAYARLGRHAEALEQYDTVLAARPNHASTLVKRAVVRINLGQADAALTDFQRAVELEPDDPRHRQSYIEALEYLGQSAQAQEQRQRLSTAASAAGSGGARRAQLAAAQDAVRRGDFATGIERFEQILAEDPEAIEAKNGLASVYGHQGRFQEATTLFDEILQAEPRHTAAHHGRIVALILSARYGEARDRLREALQLYPRNAALAETLARLLASAPDAAARKGDLAVQLAERIVQMQSSDGGSSDGGSSDGSSSDRNSGDRARETLAMALAEDGRFSAAADLQKVLVERSTSAASAQELSSARLQSYESQQPWRARSPDELLEPLRPENG